jgi:hypothetical protein
MNYATIEMPRHKDHPPVFEQEVEPSYNQVASQIGNPIQVALWSANRFEFTSSVQRSFYFSLRSCLPLFYLLGFLLSLYILASTTKESLALLFAAIRGFWLACWMNFDPSWQEWFVSACGAVARFFFGVIGSIAIVLFMVAMMGLLCWGVSVMTGQAIFVLLTTATSLACTLADNLLALLRWMLRKSYKLLHFSS